MVVFQIHHTDVNAPRLNDNDEVMRYQIGRYISSNEAVWRIFGFPIHERDPAVIHLAVYLENGQRPPRLAFFYRRSSSTALHSFFCIDPVPTYPFDRHHIRDREDRLPTAQRQIRPNLHVFARYPCGIYPQIPRTELQHTTTAHFQFSNLIFHLRFILTFDFFDISACVSKRPDEISSEMLDCADISPHRYSTATFFFSIEHKSHERFPFLSNDSAHHHCRQHKQQTHFR